jgi:uncharacterized protein
MESRSPLSRHARWLAVAGMLVLVVSGAIGTARAAPHARIGRHTAVAWHPTHLASRRNPIRVVITGDSLPGFIGQLLVPRLDALRTARAWMVVKDGTGITRPDYFDWAAEARRQVAVYHADATIVMIGGNDFQNIVAGGRVLLAGSKPWTREYQRRVTTLMRIWAQGGRHRVYWLSMPPSRNPSWAYDDWQIDNALRRAAPQVQGALFVNINGPITNRGHYADYVRYRGQIIAVREDDGVHVNLAGSQIVTNDIIFPLLKREWHL